MTEQFPIISEAGYMALCEFCDEATSQPYTLELSRLVDAATVLMLAYEERRTA